MITIPPPGRRLRLAALAYGGLLLLWMPLEDHATWPVALLGVALSILIGGLTISAKLAHYRIVARHIPAALLLLGGLVGLGASIGAAALMFFKNAWHAHLFLDYPPAMMLDMLARAPVWALAGALIGLGLGLAWLALRREA